MFNSGLRFFGGLINMAAASCRFRDPDTLQSIIPASPHAHLPKTQPIPPHITQCHSSAMSICILPVPIPSHGRPGCTNSNTPRIFQSSESEKRSFFSLLFTCFHFLQLCGHVDTLDLCVSMTARHVHRGCHFDASFSRETLVVDMAAQTIWSHPIVLQM
ncbi:predicted protein [Plenodomus lingam JN3]|uniref:Predicted protein n=1 Tax=Leptosphaeria maculans (strain JN3 / isolate v23.1.3 / race Av1-4-5-6-7-8) TaxID=985895 RepID=E5R4X1_LEPMJ|nr:predicted protein [Plenodomus lingam JN3]CBX92244.1 predicted protein [Plenodomus lingam JN3]